MSMYNYCLRMGHRLILHLRERIVYSGNGILNPQSDHEIGIWFTIFNADSIDGNHDFYFCQWIDGKCVRDFVACPRATSLSERQKAEVREYANVDGLLRSLQYINSRNDTADAEE